ncbi:MAG: AHH domain-containing protein [Anaerolineaceae bacterium]
MGNGRPGTSRAKRVSCATRRFGISCKMNLIFCGADHDCDRPVSQGYNLGDMAHHIVGRGRAGAQAARDILQKWGIDIQSHYNGLWLDSATHYTTFPRDSQKFFKKRTFIHLQPSSSGSRKNYYLTLS